jgi:hypothetical protein
MKLDFVKTARQKRFWMWLKNVWSKRADASFHLTFIAVNVFAVSPSFVCPGQRVAWDMMNGCDIAGGADTVAPKGFMNASLVKKRLHHFHSTVPETTKRPLKLVYDGYSSQFKNDFITKAIRLNIILVLLP